MINPEELAICRRRTHWMKGGWPVSQMWRQCLYCGMWLRETRTVEEREDTPPYPELDPVAKMQQDRADRGDRGDRGVETDERAHS